MISINLHYEVEKCTAALCKLTNEIKGLLYPFQVDFAINRSLFKHIKTIISNGYLHHSGLDLV